MKITYANKKTINELLKLKDVGEFCKLLESKINLKFENVYENELIQRNTVGGNKISVSIKESHFQTLGITVWITEGVEEADEIFDGWYVGFFEKNPIEQYKIINKVLSELDELCKNIVHAFYKRQADIYIYESDI